MKKKKWGSGWEASCAEFKIQEGGKLGLIKGKIGCLNPGGGVGAVAWWFVGVGGG